MLVLMLCCCTSNRMTCIRAQLRTVWVRRIVAAHTQLSSHSVCVCAGVFIGEAAQTMVQNVDYEVPYLRKQMTKCSQQMADAERRHGEYVRSATQCAANYKKARHLSPHDCC